MDDNLRAEDARLAAQVERLRAELAVAREQQTATSEILRVIASSPDDVQPVLDTIVRNAVVLCNAIEFTDVHARVQPRLDATDRPHQGRCLEIQCRRYHRAAQQEASAFAALGDAYDYRIGMKNGTIEMDGPVTVNLTPNALASGAIKSRSSCGFDRAIDDRVGMIMRVVALLLAGVLGPLHAVQAQSSQPGCSAGLPRDRLG